MPRFPQHMNGKGSLKDIQILVNDYPQLLDGSLIPKCLPEKPIPMMQTHMT
ncbi:hypothetical protein COLU111180_18575 [Cohnella lubricantis]|nr:hypothetical protein [Cohnella lubricantis]